MWKTSEALSNLFAAGDGGVGRLVGVVGHEAAQAKQLDGAAKGSPWYAVGSAKKAWEVVISARDFSNLGCRVAVDQPILGAV